MLYVCLQEHPVLFIVLFLITSLEVFVYFHLFLIDFMTNVWCPQGWCWVRFWTWVFNYILWLTTPWFYGNKISYDLEVEFFNSVIYATGTWGRFVALLKFYFYLLLWIILLFLFPYSLWFFWN